MKMFLKTRLSSASAVLAFVLLLPAMGNAQTINGSISGAVADQPNNNVITTHYAPVVWQISRRCEGRAA
jgi:hypothetical protein